MAFQCKLRVAFEQSGWYTNVWRGWATNNSLTDLHPVVPENFKRVRVQPLFRLTPALRTLHLDAKKGRDRATSFVPPINKNNGSPVGNSWVEGGGTVLVDVPPPGEDACSRNCESMSREVRGKGTERRGGAIGSGVHPSSGAGCEGKIVAQWTDRQRMMCLVPDVDGVAAA